MSPSRELTSQLFSEAACPPKGQKNRPLRGVGLRLVQVLRREFPQPMQPKELATTTRQSHEGTKKWLQRNEGVHVTSELRGWYRARADLRLLRQIGLEPYKVHAIKVRIVSRIGGTTPRPGGQFRAELLRDGQVQHVAEFKGRRVTWQAGNMVSVRSSTQPFTVPEFTELAAWLEGIANGAEVRLDDFDLGIDTESHRLKIAGMSRKQITAQSLTLGGFAGGLWKIYNKQVIQATRLEACLHRVDLSVKEAAGLLHELSVEPFVPPMVPSDGWEVA